jgi:hypothetical protein
MTTRATDRRYGVITDPIKMPVRVATTGPITLSGTQTVDGVALSAGGNGVAPDRVLVKDQTDQTTNGIYDVSSVAWTRSADFNNGPYQVTTGTLVYVNAGTANAGHLFKVTTVDPIYIGGGSPSNLTFADASVTGPPGPTGPTGPAGGGLNVATVALTASQINHLFSAPQTVLAAPGAGKAIVPIFVSWCNHPGSIPTGGGSNADAGNVILAYTDANGLVVVGDAAVFEASVPSFVFAPSFTGAYGSGIGTTASIPPGTGTVTGFPYTSIANQPLVISNNLEDYVKYGAILTGSITAAHAGTGYVIGDTGTVGGSYGTGATYVVDTVGGGGAVATYHLTANGKQYKTGITGNATATGGSQPGVGTGFQIDVNSVTPGNGSGEIMILYMVKTLP